MSPVAAVMAVSAVVLLALAVGLTRRDKDSDLGLAAFAVGGLAFSLALGFLTTDYAKDKHRNAWGKVAAVYDITIPAFDTVDVPTKDRALPVPVIGRVNGHPSACQAFYADQAVKVTCGSVEADRH